MNLLLVDRQALDVLQPSDVASFCKHHQVDVIVNCAAYTAVDDAEENQASAYAINQTAVAVLAAVAKRQAIKLIHISTDFVFDGMNDKPYCEINKTNPQTVYGRSKLAGESALKEANPWGSIIIRTSWLYSSFGSNFLKTMLTLGAERESIKVVADQIGSPTYARDLAFAILKIIPQLKNESVELYHFSNKGACSWYEFAQAIFDEVGVDCEVIGIPSSEYPARADRPHYSVLNSDKVTEKYDLNVQDWKASLSSMLKRCVDRRTKTLE